MTRQRRETKQRTESSTHLLVCGAHGRRRVRLCNALKKKSSTILRHIEPYFEIRMLAADFRCLGKERQVRLLEMEPALWIIMNALGDLTRRRFRGKFQE